MRKFYSLVLIAAALLIGTNVQAEKVATMTLNGVQSDVENLYDAFTTILSTENAVASITLEKEATLAGSPSRLKFDGKQDITLDLAGFDLVDGLRIDVIDAKLRVINSAENNATIDATNCNPDDEKNLGNQAFNTYGVSQTDPTVARDACYFLLGERVVLNVKSYGVGVMFYGLYTSKLDKSHSKYAATATSAPTYGSTTEIKGEIYASAGSGIATNGTMNFKDNGDKTKCPIINIYPSARIVGSSAMEEIQGANTKDEPKAVYNYYVQKGEDGNQIYKTTNAAVYGPGYAEWNIKGYLAGGVGLYLKSGKYNIEGAEIHATSAEYWEPIAYGNGFIGAGSAIVFDANASYGGNIEMKIEGETKVSSDAGYAIQDAKTTGTTTAVTGIEIKSGSFESNSPTGDAITTTPELKEQIVANGSITGGTYNSDITEYLSNVTGVITPTTDEQGNTVYVINEKPAEKSWLTTIVGASAADYVRMENGSPVELSADAQAKYLVMIGTAKIVVPAGKKLTVEEIVMGENAVIEVAAGGKLIVTGAQGIVANHASNLVLHTVEGEHAIFLLNPAVTSNKNPNATVEFVTNSWYESASAYQWERFGIPTIGALKSISCDKVAGVDVYEEIAVYSNTTGWSSLGYIGGTYSIDESKLNQPFAAYNMMAYRAQGETAPVCKMTGELVGNADAALNAEAHWNLFANSYTAEVDLATMLNAVKNANTGLYAAIYLATPQGNGNYAWNAKDVEDAEDGKLKLEPMQSFILLNEGEAVVSPINYASMVYTPATSANNAPRRFAAASDNTAKLRVIVTNEEGTGDYVKFRENVNATAFEKFMNDDVNIYATADMKASIVAAEDINNSYVGFSTVKGGNFTISFANVEGREFELVDHETGARVAIAEGNTYEFNADANTVNDYRFEIVGRANMPTAIDNTEAVKSAKGVYTITGQYVGEMNVWNTLPAGVYVVNGEKRVK